MNFKEIPYKRIDLDRTEKKFMNFIEEIIEAPDVEIVLDNIKKIQEIQRNVDTQFNIASIRSDINTNDEYYEKEIEFWNNNIPIIEGWYMRYYEAVLESNYRKELEEHLPPIFFKIANNAIKSFNPNLISPLQEEKKYIRKYTKLIATAKFKYKEKQLNLANLTALLESTSREERKRANKMISDFFAENLEEFDKIYDKLVDLRNRMSQKLNFRNFYDMSYTKMNRIGYGKEDIESFRKNVLKVVVPFTNKIIERQKERNKINNFKNYDMDLKFPTGNAGVKGEPKEIISNCVKMYHKLSEDTKEFIDFMVNNDLLDLETKSGKAGGAYSEYIFNYRSPFIFTNFNGTSGDVKILTHEAGHAFQAYKSRSITIPELIWPTSESVEIHAMGMEFFTWPWMDLFFGDETEKYKYSHIVDASMLICYATLVDHFQQEIYENPDMTPENRRNIWRKLEKQYNPWIDYDGNKFYEDGGRWLRQHHIFTIPFYYIEYALAQVCALEIWDRIYNDKDKNVWEDFLKICNIGGTKSFSEIIDMVNIESPFKESTLKSVVLSMKGYLESVDENELK